MLPNQNFDWMKPLVSASDQTAQETDRYKRNKPDLFYCRFYVLRNGNVAR
jgi:hypothetical protein